jgi:hypothetical protein
MVRFAQRGATRGQETRHPPGQTTTVPFRAKAAAIEAGEAWSGTCRSRDRDRALLGVGEPLRRPVDAKTNPLFKERSEMERNRNRVASFSASSVCSGVRKKRQHERESYGDGGLESEQTVADNIHGGGRGVVGVRFKETGKVYHFGTNGVEGL